MAARDEKNRKRNQSGSYYTYGNVAYELQPDYTPYRVREEEEERRREAARIAKEAERENKVSFAKMVGVGAVIFNDLSNNRIKDEIFDWDIMLNFNGETGPYMQYIYVRTKSVLEKAGYIPKLKDVNLDKLLDEDSVKVIKLLYQFNDKIMQAIEKYEPYIVARYLIEVAKTYSSFYNNNKIICDDKEVQDARIYLTYATGIVLKTGAALLGIKMPDKM